LFHRNLDVIFHLVQFLNFQIKNINDKKIQDEILNLKKNLLNFSFQKFSGQLEKTSQIKQTKKQIARLKSKSTNGNGEKNA
jgi:large subunit ribosomal protein L29